MMLKQKPLCVDDTVVHAEDQTKWSHGDESEPDHDFIPPSPVPEEKSCQNPTIEKRLILITL